MYTILSTEKYLLYSESTDMRKSLCAMNLVQSNEKEIMRIFIENLQGYPMEFSYNEILAVASQCPYTGGNAVFSARALICLINDSIYFDDTYLCAPSSGSRINQNEEVSGLNNGDWSVFPNPASEELNVILDDGVKYRAIAIFDQFGRKVKNVEISVGNLVFDISDLSPGMYFVHLIGNDDGIMQKRFVKSN